MRSARRILVIAPFLIFHAICSAQVVTLTNISLDSVRALIGYAFPDIPTCRFSGLLILRDGVTDSVSVKYHKEAYDEDLDADFLEHHEYNAKFDPSGLLLVLDARHSYNDGIDISFNYQFRMTHESTVANCWFKGNYGHIMPVTELTFQIEPFDFQSALKKVHNWWSDEFNRNRHKYEHN